MSHTKTVLEKVIKTLESAFRMGPAGRKMLPSLCDSMEIQGWSFGRVDECDGVPERSRGGAIAGLERAGVIHLREVDPRTVIDGQKIAVFTDAARAALREAGLTEAAEAEAPDAWEKPPKKKA